MTIDSFRKHPGRVIAATAFAVLLIGVISILVKYPSLLRPAPSIPFEHMDLEQYDVDGSAIVESPYFVITFSGESFAPHPYRLSRRLIKGRYFDFPPSKVGPNNPLGSTPGIGKTEVDYGFSAKDQLFLMQYQAHVLSFSVDQQQLTIDGHEFSTAVGRILLTIDKTGNIVSSSLAPNTVVRTRDPAGYLLHVTTTATPSTGRPTSTALSPLD